jgi:hypothetical protein
MTTPQSHRCPVFCFAVGLAFALLAVTSAPLFAGDQPGPRGKSAALAISVTVVRPCTVENTAPSTPSPQAESGTGGQAVTIRCGKYSTGYPVQPAAGSPGTPAASGPAAVASDGRTVTIHF